jgi:hypothetical protein
MAVPRIGLGIRAWLVRAILLGLGLGTLISCELLFAPKRGRWNPYDPQNELVVKTARLSPVLEGYVCQGDGAFYFDSSLKVSVDSAGDQHAALMRFDLTQVPIEDPLYLVGGRLVLYCASLDQNEYLAVYPIIKTWDTSVTYATATSPAFIDNSIDIGFPLSIIPNAENSYDATPILRAWYTGLSNYGVRLHGDPSRYTADTWFSSSLGSSRPRLEVDYLAPP